MTTVTIITGRNGSGRSLIGRALSLSMTNSLLITGKGTCLMLNGYEYIEELPDQQIKDVILVMGSEHLEEWTAPFIEKYGRPLFHIHAQRIAT